MRKMVIVFTLSVVSHVSILEKTPFFQVRNLHQYNLGSTFLIIEAILEKKRVELRQ